MIDPKSELTIYARYGSEDAFRRLVDHFGGLVLNSALRRVNDPGLAEETAQNVFAHLARKAAQVSKYRSISAWLFETTRLESAKTLRSQHRHQRRLEALSATSPPSTMSDDLDQELRDLLPHLEESLDSLKPGERQILLARFFDHQSFPDIATSTGKSESACKMSLRRTLEKLRLKLSSRGITFSAVTLGTLLQTEWAKAVPTHFASLFNSTRMTSQASGWAANFFGNISTPKILTLVAVTFLGIACHQIIQRDSKTSTSGVRTKTPAPSSTTKVSRSRFPAQKTSTRKIQNQTHQASDLKSFYLPLPDLKNTSLEAAGKIIIGKYQSICKETGEIPLPLTWEVNSRNAYLKKAHLGAKTFITVNGIKTESQHAEPLLHLCQKLAILTGTRLDRKGNHFTFSEIPDGPVTSQEFFVPPTFQTWYEVFFNRDHTAMPTPGKPGFIDFTQEFQEDALLADQETVTFELSTTKLHVTAGARNMARIADLIDLSIAGPPLQIRCIPQSGMNGTFTDLPKVVALPGQTATLEVGKEYLELNGDELTTAWVGHRLEFTPEPYGLGERTTLNYTFIQEPSEKALAKYQKSKRLIDLDLKQFQINNEVIIKSAEDRLNGAGIEFSGTDRDGNALSLRFTSERIDATGRPFKPK